MSKKKVVPKKTAAPPSGRLTDRPRDRLTYRELRNTPGRVWERLANDEPLTLVADGEAKAVVIPVPGGDVASVLEAYTRGRALIALRRTRQAAKRNSTAGMSLAAINEIIREVRTERHKRERGR